MREGIETGRVLECGFDKTSLWREAEGEPSASGDGSYVRNGRNKSVNKETFRFWIKRIL